MELNELIDLIEKHDIHYEMSDDNRKYQAGLNSEMAIARELNSDNIAEVLSKVSDGCKKFVEDLYARIA